MNKIEIGKRIEAAREKMNLTQGELGALFDGKSQSVISDYERGKALPKITELPLLAEILNVNVGYFFGEVYQDDEVMGMLEGLTKEQRDNILSRIKFEIQLMQKR